MIDFIELKVPRSLLRRVNWLNEVDAPIPHEDLWDKKPEKVRELN